MEEQKPPINSKTAVEKNSNIHTHHTESDKFQPHDTYEGQCRPSHGLVIKREKDEVEYKETPECSESNLLTIQGVVNMKTEYSGVERSTEDIRNCNNTISVISLSCLKIKEGKLDGLNLKAEGIIGKNNGYDKDQMLGGQNSLGLLNAFHCREAFVIPLSCKNHAITCADIKPFRCKECRKRFKSMYSLRKHTRSHTSEKCIECGRGFLSKRQLAKHVSLCVKPYQCKECSEKFCYVGNLLAHMKYHGVENPYRVEKLRTDSEESINVRRARKIISKEVFGCSECPRTFQRKSNLHFHKLTHAGIKPHECQDCFRKFNRKTDLSNHKRWCEKPIMCKICRQMFIYIGNLIKHMEIHEKEFVEKGNIGMQQSLCVQ
ncbi:zinc finger protein 626-like [Penaeus indicus]|uniref:zinc finger protein 626-like n=1 Tax=Penaeus indicus TaxID=29960 RepID=UPI00300D6B65